MKNKLVDENIQEIKRLISRVLREHISNNKIISEAQGPIPLLRKYLKIGFSRIENALGDDVITNLESLFQKSKNSIVKDAAGIVCIKSKSGALYKMSAINAAVDQVAQGIFTPEQIGKLLPKTLSDGTKFSDLFVAQLKKAKPNAKKSRFGNLMNKLKSKLSNKKKYVPSPEDWDEISDILKVSGYSDGQINKIFSEAKKLKALKSPKDLGNKIDKIADRIGADFSGKKWRDLTEAERLKFIPIYIKNIVSKHPIYTIIILIGTGNAAIILNSDLFNSVLLNLKEFMSISWNLINSDNSSSNNGESPIKLKDGAGIR